MNIHININGDSVAEIQWALRDLLRGEPETRPVAEQTPPEPAVTTETAPVEVAAPKKRTTKPKAETTVQPDVEEATVVAETPTETAAPTLESVKEVLKALIAGPGENPAFALLTKYGAKNATTLLETGLAHLAIAEAKKLIEEHAAS